MFGVKQSRSRSKGTVDLNLAPLIDMIFILLIFFIVTTSFIRESGVEVKRPVAKTAQKKEKANLIIGITENNIIYIQGKPVDVRSVRARMQRFLMENPSGSVVIAADQDSRSGVVIQILDACRLAGVENISVAARKPGQ